MNNRQVGTAAEDAAVDFLINHDWQVIQRNYFCKVGELDIIARDAKGMLVFVEVRSVRFDSGLGVGLLMNRGKLFRLEKAIHYWLNAQDLRQKPWRLDFIGLTLHNKRYCIHHIKNL